MLTHTHTHPQFIKYSGVHEIMMNVDGMKLANLTGYLSFLLLEKDNRQWRLGYTNTHLHIHLLTHTVTELIAAGEQK